MTRKGILRARGLGRPKRVKGIGPPPRRGGPPVPLRVVGTTLVVGLFAGGMIGFIASGQSPTSVLRPLEPSGPPPSVKPIQPNTLLAWTPGGLPAGLAQGVGRIRGVDQVVAVMGGTAWMSSSVAADGARVDVPPAGLAIPLEIAGADPRAYAPFLSPADRSLLPALERGDAVLGATSARLRRIGTGGTLVFGTTRIRVAGVVPDAEIGAHEVFVSRQVAKSLGIHRDRYLLIAPAEKASRRRITSRIKALLPQGLPLRVRGPGETPFFRQGDAVLPPVKLKELFGEFAARPIAGGYLAVDPGWVRTHITNATVPILGQVRCNRAIIPQLRGALAEVVSEGLERVIDKKGYAGCYSSRFINRNPESGISHHAWGVAFDINTRRNVFGKAPHQDPRLVAILERWGFTWGGQWLVPDGMHFEFVRFP